MPGLIMEPAVAAPSTPAAAAAVPAAAVEAPPPEYGFVVTHQKVELEVDFRTQSISGRSELTIAPQTRELKTIRIDARQCEIPEDGVTVNGRVAYFDHEDPYEKVVIPKHVKWTADQFELQRERIKKMVINTPATGELIVTIPKSVHIEETDPFAESASNALLQRTPGNGLNRAGSFAGHQSISTPVTATPRQVDDGAGRYSPITVSVPFKIKHFREGLRFVGLDEGDMRYPHVYTMHSISPGMACCIFPCIDDPSMHCTWELSIKCSRTLGHALKPPASTQSAANGLNKYRRGVLTKSQAKATTLEIELSEDDRNLEMVVVCSGDLMDEAIDPVNNSKRTVTYLVENPVAARHIGFAIGPFEHVDLSEFREEDEDEKLGQKAVQVHGYCLPGRLNEIRNTCEAMAHAIDYFTLNFGSYPFSDYSMVFVDDQISDTVPLASISLCSTRLLIPEDIIDPEVEVTRKLTHALASQWIGVNITPAERADTWAVVGISHFITDLFMKNLCGNNEYRFRQKQLTDKLVDLDMNRPTLYALGEILHLGSFELEFMELKAPLVLFILDRRLNKASGSTGLPRVISRLILAANTGGAAERLLSSDSFRRLCEKVGHYKLEPFWNQWVHGAGCPRFTVNHRFNKKRLTVEMNIIQRQESVAPPARLSKDGFIKEYKEEAAGVYAGELQSVFTGPMTIRIHEADGTPYEHIVEIREGSQKIEIPYNTKYKRLKRSRRQRERQLAGIGADMSTDNQDDALLYCLGDVLQSPEDVKEWGLTDWDAENEQRMDQESYEWIRMDADFEWLCELTFTNMPSYMYVSQLQQDRDVVAQQESMLYLKRALSHPLVSTFLVRTLMDRRYFHGIRTMAAEFLTKHATEKCGWIGRIHLEKSFQHFFCYPGSLMPQTNDFRDKAQYLIKCAIPKAIARIRNADGKCPLEARQFVLDQLRFNDNGNNEFSDCFYIAALMNALTDCLLPLDDKDAGGMSFSFEEEDQEELLQFQKAAIGELERYRRMDEWILSYQNTYTNTALDCLRRLMKANVIKPNPLEFVQYVHDGTLDEVRIMAFDCLVDINYMQNDLVLQLLLNVMSTDPSPYVRDRLFKVFGEGLAVIAFGEHKPATKAAVPEADGLIVEQDTEEQLEAKRAQIARVSTIEGALVAIKQELHKHKVFKQAIWAAIRSPMIGVQEQWNLLGICWMLYDPKESMIIAMPWPRYWRAKYLGRGIVRFKKTKKIRTKMVAPIQTKMVAHVKAPPPASPATPHPPTPSIIRLGGGSSSTMKPPKRPLPVEKKETYSHSSHASQPPRKIVKLKISDFSKIRTKAPTMSAPPSTPQPSSGLSRVSASTMARAASTPATPSSSTPAPVRKPLPDFVRKPLPDTIRKPLPDSIPRPAPPPSQPPQATSASSAAADTPVKKAILKLKFNLPKKT